MSPISMRTVNPITMTTPAILHRVGQTFASKTVALIDSGFDPDEPLLPGAQHRPRIRVVLQDVEACYRALGVALACE